jgi:pimeloyl-ACP methyl ester carboxylesterase
MRASGRKAMASLAMTALLSAWSIGSPASATEAVSDPTLHMVEVSGHRIAFHVIPGHGPIVVFDAGGGSDSSYWMSVLPQIAKQTGVKLITYDRAGFGQSDEVQPPYAIEQSVLDLEAGLKQLGATKDIILVAHSFAGEVDTFLAIEHPTWILGAVLVDANVPNFFADEETDHLYKAMPSSIPNTIKQNRTMAALIAAWPKVNRQFHNAVWPAQIPCTVIASEQSPRPGTADADQISSLSLLWKWSLPPSMGANERSYNA